MLTTGTVVVGMRARLRPLQHGAQVQHRHHAAPNRRLQNTQDHHLERDYPVRSIRRSVLPALRLTVHAIFLFLDALH